MPARGLTRRAAMLLPLIIATCGREERRDFPPLRYDYLPPIRLNVAALDIQQRFAPLGMAPDVTQFAPVRPMDALIAMAQDRLMTVGNAGTALFAISDASLTRREDTITGRMAVVLSIHAPDGARLGFAEARVSRQRSGHIDDRRGTLYDMTAAMMEAMNIEFEYQVRRNLRSWLASDSAVPSPVQRQPLEMPKPDE